MVNIDIKFGFKEIIGLAISIPLAYEKVRKLKLKYDLKEQKETIKLNENEQAYIFNDVVLCQDGSVWRKEK
jgi:hypothetical protein